MNVVSRTVVLLGGLIFLIGPVIIHEKLTNQDKILGIPPNLFLVSWSVMIFSLVVASMTRAMNWEVLAATTA